MTWQASATVLEVANSESGGVVLAAVADAGQITSGQSGPTVISVELVINLSDESTDIKAGDEILLTGALLSVGRPASV